jgi:hypothetical protein
MNLDDAEKLYNTLEEDLLEDIEETADPSEWNNDDFLIALRRTLFARLHID